MTTKKFTAWTQHEVEKAFDLELIFEHEILEEWMQAEEPISNFEEETLEKLRKKASIYGWEWNETELTAKFIGAVTNLVDFDQIKYTLFFERPINFELKDGNFINGIADLIIAKGRGAPEKPYFFMQEFKKEKGGGDAIAQVLLAMLFAQQQNEGKELVYGGVINGRNWFFIILDGNNYTISDAFVATQKDDLFSIFKILKRLKKIIESKIK